MKFKLKLLPAALLLAGLSPLTAQAVVLPIIADTYLTPTTAGTSVAVNVNANNKALLNFDVSTLPVGITSADITKATLVFFVKTVPTAGQLQVSPLTSAWTENTANTSNAPTAALPLATSANISNGNSYFAVDVTDLAKNWIDVPTSNFGLALEPLVATTTSLTLDSKEAIQTSHPAYIEIALKGPAGDKGAIGATGPQGIQGQIGLTGSAGVNGANGVDGAQGLTGATGPQGAMPVGQTAGDMQYWNGSTWINIAAGISSATLKNCNGVPTWTTTNCSVLKIGDTGPAGGIVFYLTDTTGLHGLEAAPVDQSSGVQWGCFGTTVDGGMSTAVNTGKANTAAINSKCGIGTAAQIAASYSLNGFSDWYLPSKDELNLLYAQKTVVGGFALTYSYYWSSTEYDRNFAGGQHFDFGYQGNYLKSSILPVRAVRAF